jgi:hypothetical protein
MIDKKYEWADPIDPLGQPTFAQKVSDAFSTVKRRRVK